MLTGNMQLHEAVKIVTGLAPITPSTSTPDYVSLRGYERCCIVIVVDNATPVTGSAITVKQASAVAGTGEKAVSFSTMWANTDTGAGDALTATAVTSDTFTTDTTANKNLLYVIEVRTDDLDLANNFDCIRAGTGNAVNTVLAVLYLLYPARYARTAGPVPSAIID
jgi:hypothetical protein